jgi:hypothetical protein
MKHGMDMKAAKNCKSPWCAHSNEYSAAIANRSSGRTDILDSMNGGDTDQGQGPGNGSAPGASGEPTTGGPVGGIPYGID